MRRMDWALHDRIGTALMLCAAALAPAAAFAAAAGPAAQDTGPVFAVIGKHVISAQDYEAAYRTAKRQKFYHGQPPEKEIAALRRSVADELVNRVLLLDEAQRRGIHPDSVKVRQLIEGYEKRYAGSAQWQQNRARLLPGLTAQLEAQSVLEQLERAVRNAGEPRGPEIHAYYESHREQFTEPEQMRLSVILLKVDPSAPKLAWDKAREEGEAIARRLRGGADFAGLARLHSADPSAQNGGDMGYVHESMLSDGLGKVVGLMKQGELSAPVRGLEGYAILRLEHRKPKQLRAFKDVAERAGKLWQRDEGERRFKALVASLRRSATVRIDSARYPDLALESASAK